MSQTPMSPQLPYSAVREIFTRFRDANPEPKTELYYINPYTLLVAVVFAAQATDAGVNRVTRDLFTRIDSPSAMVAFGLDALMEATKTIGLYRQKAKNVIRLSEILLAEHGGEVPTSRAALVALPGVGRKSANVLLNVCFHQPVQPVDTHAFRVANRTGIAPGKDVDAVERNLDDQIPAEFKAFAHHWLVLHGRYICLARKPRCPDCLIRDICLYSDKTE